MLIIDANTTDTDQVILCLIEFDPASTVQRVVRRTRKAPLEIIDTKYPLVDNDTQNKIKAILRTWHLNPSLMYTLRRDITGI